MTPEQRVDAGIAAARFGQVGLGSLGVGERMGTGGGGGGQFMFADLGELDAVKSKWIAERDRILSDGGILDDAIRLCSPPADDTMSHYQADRMRESLMAARDHNQAMLEYAEGYVQKLEASRAAMAGTEHNNKAKLRTIGEA